MNTNVIQVHIFGQIQIQIIFGFWKWPNTFNIEQFCFEVFWGAGSDWPLCKISTLSVRRVIVLPIRTPQVDSTFLTKFERKDFPLGLWAVFHLSQTASYGSKFGPLLFALWGQEFHSKCSAIVKFAYLHIRIHYADFSMRFHADMRISIRINRNRICAYEKQPHGQL